MHSFRVITHPQAIKTHGRASIIFRRNASTSQHHPALRLRTWHGAVASDGIQTASTDQDTHIIRLPAMLVTPEAFAQFGQVVSPGEDGQPFGRDDAQLVLDRGTPRLYIMRIPRRGLQFHNITFHAQVTQCLGALAPVQHWYLAVGRPTGDVSVPPRPERGEVAVFRVPHGVYLKLHAATWHAGPLFQEADHMDFFNLELADTNVADYNTHDYMADGIQVQVVDAGS